MVSKAKLEQIYWDVMSRLYAEADPPLDIIKYRDELIAKNKKSPEGWFNDYYLSQDRQEEIFEEILKVNKLSNPDKERLGFAVYLGFAPRGFKEGLNETNKVQ